MNRAARAISDVDRRRIWTALDAHSTAGDFIAIRGRAIATLVIDTGLRLSELLALNIEQLVEDPTARAPRILGTFDLRATQAKNSKAASMAVPKRARDAIRVYLLELRRREWIKAPPWRGPLWIVHKSRVQGKHPRLSKRAAQTAWSTWQKRAGIHDPYRFHDLRHTAITRWADSTDNAFSVAELARHSDVKTSMRYVHGAPDRLREIAERASRKT